MVPNCGTIRKIEDSYTYDAWGNCSVVINENNVANINPFRYRGYYFDTESGLYYLMSRYYDPEIGQFISMDTPDYLEPNTIGGVNLYAYGLNNPVIYNDPTGHSVAVVLGIIFAGAALIYNLSQTIKTQKYIDENYEGVERDLLTASNIVLGYGVTSALTVNEDSIDAGDNPQLLSIEFDKHKNYNIFTSFQYANALKKRGLPDNRTYLGIWLELVGHHIVNTFDIFNFIGNDDQADMGNFKNDSSAWIWEVIGWLI